MAKIVQMSGSGRKTIVEKNLNPTVARELADMLAKGHAPGSSTYYRVIADNAKP